MQLHGKEITTVISDLDGTLLGNAPDLDPALLPLITELKKKGISFVAASGRQYRNMSLLFEPIKKDMVFVAENGSMVVKNDTIVFANYIPRELSMELLHDMLTVPNTETIASSNWNLYTLSSREAFIKRMQFFLKPALDAVERYEDITTPINKISIWWENGIPEDWKEWFWKKYEGRLQIADGGNGWLDFTMEGVNKGTALRELEKREGFSLENAVCFGDSENDIAMFRECGYSYAMATGREHVKAEADAICTDVGDMLRAFLKE